jgi:hypothetical protein
MAAEKNYANSTASLLMISDLQGNARPGDLASDAALANITAHALGSTEL